MVIMMKTCSICDRKHYAKGLCRYHYHQKPEVKEKKRLYMKLYNQKPEAKAREKQNHWKKEVVNVPHFSKEVKNALIMDGLALQKVMIKRGIIQR